tara:strand:+ start:2833 stop:3807 length:975 start_codon:yes stop_codon:yes gene_type:complete
VEPKKIAISVGEPAGIGPDILIQTIQSGRKHHLIAHADPDLLVQRAKTLNLPLKLVDPSNKDSLTKGVLAIAPQKLSDKCIPGKLNANNSDYVIRCLDAASEDCLTKSADALVTGPIQKSIINETSIKFTGHTEYLANKMNVPNVVMMLASDKMKVALVTTHIPISQVAGAITTEKLKVIIKILNNNLITHFDIKEPKIMVCGLNPHAGESGHIGHEEEEIIKPALKDLIANGIKVTGPRSADTIFNHENIEKADTFLAMYHDQGLPVIKSSGFGGIANITLGLPIIRTSVDHGTALLLAGSGKTTFSSLKKAIDFASEMSIKK